MAYQKRLGQDAPVYVSYLLPTAGSNLFCIFISDSYYEVEAVYEAHQTPGNAASTFTLKRLANGELTDAGVAITTPMPFDGIGHTVQQATLTAIPGHRLLAPGDRIGVQFSPTPGGTLPQFTIRLKRLRPLT
jgi:hypothetical protein